MGDGVMSLVLATAVAAIAVSILVPVLAVSRPPVRVLLGVYAFVLPFGSAVELPRIPEPFNSLSSLVGMAVAALLLLHVFVDRRTREWSGSTISWLLLTGWVGLTVLWSLDPASSLSRYLILLSLVALYAVAALLPLSRRDIRWMELGVVLGAVSVSVYAIYLAATGQLEPQPGGRLPRFAIETGDPNITAASLLLPWVLTTWTALNASRRTWRTASIAATLLILAAIVLTGSRGALVAAAAAALVIVLCSSPRGRLRALPYGLVAAVVGAAAFVVSPAGLQNHLLATHSSGRLEIWATALASCTEGCWVGSGWGSFGDVYRTTYLSDLSVEGAGDRSWAAHNIFIGLLVDAGLIGLVLMVAAFALLFRDLVRLPSAVAGPALAAVTALLVANMLLSNMAFKYFWFTLLYGAAVVQVHAGASQRAERARSSPPPGTKGAISRSP